MTLRGGSRPFEFANDDVEISVVTLERLERRLGDECGQLRVELGGLRAEMADRSFDLLKWLVGLFVAQTAALGALMKAFSS
jgi:hypothetical protein